MDINFEKVLSKTTEVFEDFNAIETENAQVDELEEYLTNKLTAILDALVAKGWNPNDAMNALTKAYLNVEETGYEAEIPLDDMSREVVDQGFNRPD